MYSKFVAKRLAAMPHPVSSSFHVLSALFIWNLYLFSWQADYNMQYMIPRCGWHWAQPSTFCVPPVHLFLCRTIIRGRTSVTPYYLNLISLQKWEQEHWNFTDDGQNTRKQASPELLNIDCLTIACNRRTTNLTRASHNPGPSSKAGKDLDCIHPSNVSTTGLLAIHTNCQLDLFGNDLFWSWAAGSCLWLLHHRTPTKRSFY